MGLFGRESRAKRGLWRQAGDEGFRCEHAELLFGEEATNGGVSAMNAAPGYILRPIGLIRSALQRREEAPRQGTEGAPDAWLEVAPEFAAGLEGLVVGQEIVVLTWLHEAARDRLTVHPRGDVNAPLAGVFATRSPTRPNPLGLHRVTIQSIDGLRLRIGPMEAIDETPVVDLKPVLAESGDA